MGNRSAVEGVTVGVGEGAGAGDAVGAGASDAAGIAPSEVARRHSQTTSQSHNLHHLLHPHLATSTSSPSPDSVA